MTALLLRVFSLHRSLQKPVPNGSCARLSIFQYANRPKRRLLAEMLTSARATYSSTFPPVLAALTKLFVVALLVGIGMKFSKKLEVGLIRLVGIMLPVNGVRAPVARSTESGS